MASFNFQYILTPIPQEVSESAVADSNAVWKLLGTETASGSSSSIGGSIDCTGHKEFMVIMTGNSSHSSNDWMRLELNGDTTDANYRRTWISQNSGTVGGQFGDNGQVGQFNNGSSSENSIFCTLAGFDSDKMKSCEFKTMAGDSTGEQWTGAITWENTSALITSIEFTLASGNFRSNSKIVIYGRND